VNALQLEAVEPVIETLEIASIDRTVQVRVKTDRGTVEDYARAMAADPPASFPPVVVFRCKKTGALYLSDGNHRLEARSLNGETTIDAIVHEGGRREALAHAVGSSKGHGLRFSNADKNRAVSLALKDSKLKKLSDNQLASMIGVSQPFVSKLRASLITVIRPEPEADAEQATPVPELTDPEAALVVLLLKKCERIVSQCPESKREEFSKSVAALLAHTGSELG
jgi:hypothetical protein